MLMNKPIATGAALLLTMTSHVAVAQTTTLKEVVVTGSYIKSTPIDAPSPVQVIDRDAIEAQGASTVWDVVKNLEVNQGSTTNENAAAENGTISGTSNVNLRNLGQNSTLTLLNGKRQVAAAALTADGSEFVDLNAIPQVMIERLEILTDGGSALYGSDAIAGVVNLILRTRFDGAEVSGRYQQVDGGDDPADSTLSALWGTSFNGGRTHIVLGGEYVKRDPVRITDTAFFDTAKSQYRGTLSSVTAVFGGPGAPQNPAWVNGPLTQQRITNGGTAGTEYTDPNCAAVGGTVGTKEEDFNNPDSSCREDTTRFQYVNVGEERKNVALALNHSFSDAAEVYSFFQYAQNDVERADDGNIGSLGPALILPSARSPANALFALGSARASGPIPTILNAPNDLANGGLDRPALVDYETNIPRTGGKSVGNESETYGGQLGLRGELALGGREYNYDLSYAYSRNAILRRDRTIVRDRAELAINGLGGPNCVPNGTPNFNLNTHPYFGSAAINNALFREYSPGYPQNLRETVSLAITSTNQGQGGCMFLNPYLSALTNPALANNPELIEWITPVVPTSDRENTLSVIDAVVSGQMFELPGGKSGFALGLQYREQHNIGRSYSLVEPGLQTIVTYAGGAPSTFRYASNDNRYGGFFTNSFDDTREIKAVFGELSLPFIKSIDTQLAVRYEDYGGGIGSEVSPKIAVRWQAVDALAFRGSYSKSFRAPNTGIVFNGTGADGTSVRDLLSATNVRAGLAEPIEANAVDSGLFQRGLASPDVKSETADTYNFGIIFAPDGVLSGLNVTLDYWRFDLKGRVVAQPLRQALNPELALFLQARDNPANYVTLASLPFNAAVRFVPCDPRALTGTARANCVVDPRAYQISGVERNTETGQLITVDTRAVNAGRVVTDGIDFRLNYNWNTSWGRFLAGLDYTFINQYKITDLVGFETGFFGTGVIDAAGTTGDGRIVRSLPDHKGHVNLTWTRDAHSVTGIARYTGAYDDLAYNTTITNATPLRQSLATRTIDSYTTFDLQYNYTKDWGGGGGITRFTVGAIDLFEAEIPFREFSGVDYDSTVFDPRGRRFYFQVGHSF